MFCQNYDISQDVRPPYRTGAQASIEQPGVAPHELAAMMLELQALGCHNINFVPPEHVAPQIAEAVPVAIRHGLRLPIVYNTSA